MEELKKLLGYILLIVSIVVLFTAVAYIISTHIYSRVDFLEKSQSEVFFSPSVSFDYEALCSYKVMHIECVDPVNGFIVQESNISIATDYLDILRVFNYNSPRIKVELAQVCSAQKDVASKLLAKSNMCSRKLETYTVTIACTNGTPHVILYSSLPADVNGAYMLAIVAVAGVLASRKLLA